MSKAQNPLKAKLTHLITVGTTPTGVGDDVVVALATDLKALAPRAVIVLATEDSRENATRLLKAIGLPAARGTVRILASAQSLDEAYQATSDEIGKLNQAGIPASDIVLHYTAGTKVMSAGAVLAAVGNEVLALRYLYAPGRGQASIPVTTVSAAVAADRQMALARTLLLEQRFRTARDLATSIDASLLTPERQEVRTLLVEISYAYGDWDNFRVREFLGRYRTIAPRLTQYETLAPFRLTEKHLAALEQISLREDGSESFCEQLLLDLLNNAMRRLAERHPDDAMIRLHRAAELFAQGLLEKNFGILTHDVDIRRIPPRHRTAFEAERRLDDATIKLGLRKSYDLLDILGHPIGAEYRERTAFREILDRRRSLVLAHGTRPATVGLAMEFYAEVAHLIGKEVKDLRKKAAAQQFPWIDNTEILTRLGRTPKVS